MDLSKFYQKDGNPQEILGKIISHRKSLMKKKPKGGHQQRFPAGFDVFPAGDQPLSAGGSVGSAVESVHKEKFRTFLESLKTDKNDKIVEIVKRGFELCLEAKDGRTF